MAQRVLGLDIGRHEVKAVLAEVSWRQTTILGAYVQPVPPADQVVHRLPPSEPDPDEVNLAAEVEDEEPTEDTTDESTISPAPTPPPWVFAVDDLIKKHGLEFQEVHCALPGTKGTSHILTLPFENRRRLEQILPFELENHVPFDLDDMHLAFEVLGKDPEGGFRILVVLTPKREMESFLLHLKQAGIDPKVIDLAPHTLFAAAKLNLEEVMGAYAVVDVGGNHTDVAIVSGSELLSLRTLPHGGDDFTRMVADTLDVEPDRAAAVKAEQGDLRAEDKVGQALRDGGKRLLGRLRQTLRSVRSEQSIDVTRMYLVGRGSLLPGLAESWAEDLGVEVERLASLSPDMPLAVSADDPANQARFTGAMALVTRGLGPLRKITLNLRHGSFFYQRQQIAFRSSLKQVAAIGLIVAVLLVYNVVADQLQKRRQLEFVQDQVVQLYMKAFPGSSPPVHPLEQFRGQISKTMAKYKTIDFFGDENMRAVEILQAMSRAIPPTVTVDIKKFDLTDEALKLEGEVASFPDVDTLESALQKIPAFKQVKKESSTTVSEKVKFRFHVGLSEQRTKSKGKRGRGGMVTPNPAAGATGS